jgi:adenylate cyclase
MGVQDSEVAETSDPHQADEGQPNPEIAERIEQTLLGGPRRYTRCEVAQAAGVSMEHARAVWRALGFADVDENARVFTDGDIEALRTWTMLADATGMGSDDKLPQVRAMGQSLSRLADWQVREIIARVGDIADPEWTEEQRASTGAELAEVVLPVVESLQSYAWRRHLVAAVGRFMSVAPDELSTTTTVVGFADIVGYTSTTRHTDIHELSGLLEAFEQNAAETIVGHHGRVVKTVGDEVLFVVDAPHDAAEIALLLSDPGRASQHLPQLRIGMALGQVLSRFGDVYGPAVNLASRLTSLARPGTALVDKELARALREDEAFRLQPRRPAAVRGYHHLRSWSLRRSKTEAAASDAMPYPAVSTHAVTGI